MQGAFLTVQEIAELLKVNQQTVYNWIFSTVFGVCPATARSQRRCAD